VQRVGSALSDEHIGLERGYRRSDHFPQGKAVTGVVGQRRQRHVHRISLACSDACVENPAGAREQVASGFVHRDGKHIRVVVEDTLDAVAMVGVDIDVGHTQPGMVSHHHGDRAGGIVVDAKPRRHLAMRVVKAARDVQTGASVALDDRAKPCDSGAAYQRGRLVHPVEGRSVSGADAAPRAETRRIPGGLHHGVDICPAVHGQKVARPGGLDFDDACPGATSRWRSTTAEIPAGAHEIDRESEALRPHRVPRPEVVFGHPVAVRQDHVHSGPPGSCISPRGIIITATC